MKQIKNNRTNIANCPVDVLTVNRTVNLIEESIKNRQTLHHVVVNARKACGVAPLAEGYELMNCDHAAEPDAGFDFTVAADLRIVADDDLVFEYAVVSEVNADHQEVFIADLCHFFVRIIGPSKISLRAGSALLILYKIRDRASETFLAARSNTNAAHPSRTPRCR